MTIEQIKNSLEQRDFRIYNDALGNLWVNDKNQLIKMYITTDKENVIVDINNYICETLKFTINQNCNIREFESKLSQALDYTANSITTLLNRWQGIVNDIKSMSENLYNNE